MQQTRLRTAVPAFLLSAGATTVLALPGGPAALLEAVLSAGEARPGAADPFGPLVAAVALLAQLLATYLLVISAVALASGVPGLVGSAARSCAVRVTPAVLRRALGVALGVTTAVSAIGAGSAAAAGPGGPPAGPTVAALDWPTAGATRAPASLDWPDASRNATPADLPAATRAPAQTPAETPTAATATADPTRPVRDAVTVAPGDTLWDIAARHLPAGAGDRAIAQAWPSWWAANRAEIGADPDLITPGTHLAPPAR